MPAGTPMHHRSAIIVPYPLKQLSMMTGDHSQPVRPGVDSVVLPQRAGAAATETTGRPEARRQSVSFFAGSSAVGAALALFCSFSSDRSLPAKPIKKACRISNNPQAFFRDGKVSQALTIVASSALRRAASLSPKLRGFLKAAVGLQDLTLSPRLFQNKQHASCMPKSPNETTERTDRIRKKSQVFSKQ